MRRESSISAVRSCPRPPFHHTHTLLPPIQRADYQELTELLSFFLNDEVGNSSRRRETAELNRTTVREGLRSKDTTLVRAYLLKLTIAAYITGLFGHNVGGQYNEARRKDQGVKLQKGVVMCLPHTRHSSGNVHLTEKMSLVHVRRQAERSVIKTVGQ